MQGVGIGPGSPNSWDAYPLISPEMRSALSALITPKAYKAMHYHPDTFNKLFHLGQMAFSDLMIFQIKNKTAKPPSQTELTGFTVVKRGDASIELLLRDSDRSAFAAIFEGSRAAMDHNSRVFNRNLLAGNTEDIESLPGMGFSFALRRYDNPPFLVLKGFYPYFSDGDANQCFFIFFHSTLSRLALISVPTAKREHALGFILEHSELHTFDKVCAACGKTGGLGKCKCGAVRYCDVECQTLHWPLHKTECRASRKRGDHLDETSVL